MPHESVGSRRPSGACTHGVHVAHFRPMCLTAWNSLRPPKRPLMFRTGATRFGAWFSWGGRPKQNPRSHPRVLGRHVVRQAGAWGVPCAPPASKGKIEK